MNKENYLSQRKELERRNKLSERELKSLDDQYLATAKFKVGDKYTHDYTEEMVHTVKEIIINRKKDVGYISDHGGLHEERYMHPYTATKRYTVTDGFSGSLEVVNLKGTDHTAFGDEEHSSATIKFRDDNLKYPTTIIYPLSGKFGANQFKEVTFELPHEYSKYTPKTKKYLKEVN
jgi:hypothetical protein